MISSYFLCASPLTRGGVVTLEGEEARHIAQSRRIHPEDRIVLQDPAGRRHWARVTALARNRLTVEVLAPVPLPPPPPRALSLLQGAVKDKAAENIVQKATELGVARLAFFIADHSPVAWKALASAHAEGRRERIAREACKQSGRAQPPLLAVHPSLSEALQGRGTDHVLWLDPDSAKPLVHQLPPPGEALLLVVGPEGGLSGNEKTLLGTTGFEPAHLGSTILRADTAALAGCTLAILA